MDDEADVARGSQTDLLGGRRDGIPDPGADPGVAGLEDRQVVRTGCEKSSGRVEFAVVKDGMQGDCEEIGE